MTDRETRVLSLLLAVCLCATLLIGCQAQPDTSDVPDTPDTPTVPDTPDEPDAPDLPDVPAEPEDPTDVIDPSKWTMQDKVTDHLTLHGRTVSDGKMLTLFWTNSGFSFNFYGSCVRAKLTMLSDTLVDAAKYAYLNIYIDGSPVPYQTIRVDNSMIDGQSVDLVRGLSLGNHTIEVRKRNEAVTSPAIGVSGLNVTDGAFIRDVPQTYAHNIEFIGDSITCGFGNLSLDGSGGDNGFVNTSLQEGTVTYATLAARALNADAHVLSRSGWCFSPDVDHGNTFYRYYEQTVFPSKAGAPWDFDAHPMDMIVINLGTNEHWSLVDGAVLTPAGVIERAVAFLELVRSHNPDAYILWAYGMMGSRFGDALAEAVEQFSQKYNDDKVSFLLLESLKKEEWTGSQSHPSIQTDINRSVVLAKEIAHLMGWDLDFYPTLQAQIAYAEWFIASGNYTQESCDELQVLIDAAKTVQSGTEAEYLEIIRMLYEAQRALIPLS